MGVWCVALCIAGQGGWGRGESAASGVEGAEKMYVGGLSPCRGLSSPRPPTMRARVGQLLSRFLRPRPRPDWLSVRPPGAARPPRALGWFPAPPGLRGAVVSFHLGGRGLRAPDALRGRGWISFPPGAAAGAGAGAGAGGPGLRAMRARGGGCARCARIALRNRGRGPDCGRSAARDARPGLRLRRGAGAGAEALRALRAPTLILPPPLDLRAPWRT